VLRSENDRLECQVLDGPLGGTKTFLTRVPFQAKYRNLDEHLFQRTQFPIRVATDYSPSSLPRETLPSKSVLSNVPTPTISQTLAYGWDDFLESSTQISRELASKPVPNLADTPKIPVTAATILDNCLPMSTQDLDFLMKDLDDEPLPKAAHVSMKQVTRTVPAPPTAKSALPEPVRTKTEVVPAPPPAKAPLVSNRNGSVTTIAKTSTRSYITANSSRSLVSRRKIAGKCLIAGPFSTGLEDELAKLSPSQLPKSTHRLYLKREPKAEPSPNPPQSAKRQRRARCCQ
jgi:hypothetical protein